MRSIHFFLFLSILINPCICNGSTSDLNPENYGIYFNFILSEEEAGSWYAKKSGLTNNELLVFDLNRFITESERGFPKYEAIAKPNQNIEVMTPGSNGNWIIPVNYAEGTLMIRAEVFNQPEPQAMRLQVCFWQDDLQGNKLGLETCTPLANVMVGSGNVVTWTGNISTMWKKNNIPLEWDRERMRYGIAIKNSQGLPVSDYQGWNWNGEDPKKWFPLNMRFTVVAVPKGATFSGWHNYILTHVDYPKQNRTGGGFISGFPNQQNNHPDIGFYVLTREKIQLLVYDINGRLIKELVNGIMDPGEYSAMFDTKLNSGLYFCKLRIGNEIHTKKLYLFPD